jgi:hypothetical protein
MTVKTGIIFDPLLAFKVGHNLDANVDFAVFLQNECGIHAEIWAADIFDASSSTDAKITPTIPWIFEYVWQTQSLSAMARLTRMARRARDRATIRRSWWIPSLALNLVCHVGSLHVMTKTVRAALNENSDFMLFPNVDFYSLLCLYKLASVNALPSNTRLIIRLIDVLENFAYIPNCMQLIITILRRLQDYKNIIITAETEKHCANLEKALATVIPVSVIPRRHEVGAENAALRATPKPFKDDHATQFVLLCPGATRRDKGYLQLMNIAVYLTTVFGGKVILAFQQLPAQHQDFDSIYHSKLANLPNVTMLPSALSTAEYHATLNDADAILLPYDRETYRYRGSAAMFDAFTFGKPVIAMSDTGFGQTIEMYDLGFTYCHLSELQDAVRTLLSWPAKERRELQLRQQDYMKRRTTELRNIVCG